KSDPYGGVPLQLEAVLTEFELTLGKLEKLAPGDEIALTIPREMPLRIGGDVYARGVPGTFENHMALRLTSVTHHGAQAEAAS
ncbi:MAG: FliM/FliN family flagellar motor C-terminal domain-containing protein, partial [Pseudomonadota bacterium]